MPRALHLSSSCWAVSDRGLLSYRSTHESNWKTIQLPASVVDITASESCEAVYAACSDRSIHAINSETASVFLSAPNLQHSQPNCILAIPNENALFVGMLDGAIIRLHLSTLEFDCMLGCGVEHTKCVNTLVSDDHYLYSGADDSIVLIWDLVEGNPVREIAMSEHAIHSLLLVESGLWVGLSNGSVDVYDIFGDDTNGIDCLAQETPHTAPVIDLVRVGQNEVWSIESASNPIIPASSTNVIIWDTRDFSFRKADVTATDVCAALVIDRSIFEHVSVLTLTPSLSSMTITATVSGLLLFTAPPRHSGEWEAVVDDLEHQLLEAKEEIHRLRSNVITTPLRSTPGLNDAAAIDPQQYLLSHESNRTSHTNCGDSCEEEVCPAKLRRAFYDESVEGTAEDALQDQLIITSSLSQTLTSSLAKLRDLLVSLLADDVLENDESVKRSNEELRRAVANITRELHISRNLLDRCTVQGHSPRPNENDDVSNTPHTPIHYNLSDIVSQLHKEVETARQRCDDAESKLGKARESERNAIAEVEKVKQETDKTLSTLENILKEQTRTISANEREKLKLREEVDMWKEKCLQEQQKQEELSKSLEVQLGALSLSAAEHSKNYEEQLLAAYDKLETKSIEIQAQRDTIRGSEVKVENLKTSNQSLESILQAKDDELKSKDEELRSMENELKEKDKRHAEVVENLELQLEMRSSLHTSGLEELRNKHVAELKDLTQVKEKLAGTLSAFQDEFDKEKENARFELQAVKDERDRRDAQIESMRCEYQEATGELKTEVETLRAKATQLEEKVTTTTSQWEQKMQEVQERHNLELLVYKDRLDAELKPKSPRKPCLEDETDLHSDVTGSNDGDESGSLSTQLHSRIQGLEKERDELQKELEQREVAQSSFDNEIACLNSAIASYQKAVKAMEGRLTELENSEAGKENTVSDNSVSLLDNGEATNAILASAAGELKQMCNQLDALQRTRKSQEKELMALREMVSTCDEQLRLKDREIERLKENRGNTLEPLPSPGLVFNVTPDSSTKVDRTNSTFVKNINRMWNAIDPSGNTMVHSALRELEDGMSATQTKMKVLSSTAINYKRVAQAHLDALPALQELEGELVRLTQRDGRKGLNLTSARGIVQSIIAQYYTESQRRAILKDYDDALYEASEKRLEALLNTVSRMRKARTGNEEVSVQRIDELATPPRGLEAPLTRRLLQF